jgi:hypothetical protein
VIYESRVGPGRDAATVGSSRVVWTGGIDDTGVRRAGRTRRPLGGWIQRPSRSAWTTVVVGQAGASASCMEAANASGPCSAAAGSIHMTCQPWPSRSKKLREYMKP